MNQQLKFRLAIETDLSDIVEMLADDSLGSARETFDNNLPEAYKSAFRKIVTDPDQELTVAERDGQIVATFHLTFIQYLTHRGGLRAQVEAVRTKSQLRGQGIGRQVFRYILERAKEKGCNMVQLTTDKKRPDAIRFYESIGFLATHEGMKLKL